MRHHFHGPKKSASTGAVADSDRYKFDPDKDLAYDDQGFLYVVGKASLEHAIIAITG